MSSVNAGLRRALSGWSLRRKLVASIVTLFVLVSLATGIASVVEARKSLYDQLDAQVTRSSGRVGVDPNSGDSRTGGRTRGVPPGVGGGQEYLSYEADQGQGFAYTKTGSRRLLRIGEIQALLNAPLDANRPTTVDLGDDLGGYRLVRFDRNNDILITGMPVQYVEDTISRLERNLVALGFIGLLLLGGGTFWLVRVNLRPLQRVAATATRVSHLPLSSGEVSLAERVPAQDTDVRTEVGQVGAALNEMLDHVDRSLQARQASETQLRQFVADASHELRTPLASIRGYTELSRKEKAPIPESIAHALGRIESESKRMASLVEDLLLLARLDAGRPLARDKVDLTMLTIDAVSDARAAGPDHRWQLDLPEEAVEAVGDKQRLTQVVVNLLGNARVHTPAGTTVTASVRQEGDQAVLRVADDGPGIPAELLPRVFSRFTRGDNARVRAGGSTGLGLSIVHAVVSAHHGRVWVDSDPVQRGTSFTVRLPLDGPAPTASA